MTVFCLFVFFLYFLFFSCKFGCKYTNVIISWKSRPWLHTAIVKSEQLY